jgi:cytochrome c-type biogenesis protein
MAATPEDRPTVVADLTLHLSYPLAFLAGLASFLSPCVFPLLPAYLAFLGGNAGRPVVAGSAPAAGSGHAVTMRAPLLANGVAFVVGFSVVFVTFFYVFSALDVTLLRGHQQIVNAVAGGIVVVLALEVLGVLRIGLLMRERRAGLQAAPGMPGAFLLGVTFAAGWTPCIGPQLTAILAVAAQRDFGGLPVMLVYCLGLGVPFLLSAALADRLQGTIRAVNRHMAVVTRVAGVLLLLMGLLLMTNRLTSISGVAPHSPVNL